MAELGAARTGGRRRSRIKPEEEEEDLEAGVVARIEIWELQKGLPKHNADCQQQGLTNGHAGTQKAPMKLVDADDV